mmetsp:Transcript_11228/g.21362  ORF Transcript_11228/g.21362 Transcript_11228/m.21362 type:complete len:205 (-) Transcript_11228:234-848(-)
MCGGKVVPRISVVRHVLHGSRKTKACILPIVDLNSSVTHGIPRVRLHCIASKTGLEVLYRVRPLLLVKCFTTQEPLGFVIGLITAFPGFLEQARVISDLRKMAVHHWLRLGVFFDATFNNIFGLLFATHGNIRCHSVVPVFELLVQLCCAGNQTKVFVNICHRSLQLPQRQGVCEVNVFHTKSSVVHQRSVFGFFFLRLVHVRY